MHQPLTWTSSRRCIFCTSCSEAWQLPPATNSCRKEGSKQQQQDLLSWFIKRNSHFVSSLASSCAETLEHKDSTTILRKMCNNYATSERKREKKHSLLTANANTRLNVMFVAQKHHCKTDDSRRGLFICSVPFPLIRTYPPGTRHDLREPKSSHINNKV